MDQSTYYILSLAVSAAAVIASVAVYRLSARRKELDKVHERIDSVSAALADHKEAGQESREDLKGRLVKVESTLDQMPSKDSVHALNIAVTEIRGEIHTQGETLKAIGATAKRVEEFLLQNSKAK